MWVLDARKDAEKVWFPVVWEENKDTSNTIDYDIHEEITIDTSSIFNANNDTTTGMATVIPWVNAPKLLEGTSIYSNVANKTAQAIVNGSGSWIVEAVWDVKSWTIRPLSISSQQWWYTYKIWNYFNWVTNVPEAAIIAPASWIYLLKVTYYSSINSLYRYYDLYNNLTLIKTFRNDSYYSQTWSAYPTEEVYINATKGDQLAMYFHFYTNVSGRVWTTVWYSASVDIIKVW